VISDFGCNLAIRHLIYGFDTYNALPEALSLEASLELDLGLARAKYPNCVSITNK
jgi:hypothetical protein